MGIKLTDNASILAEAIRLLKEDQAQLAVPPQPPPTGAPTPAPGAPPPDPTQQQQTPPPQGGEDVNKLVGQINDIRAGSSTTAPEVFKALSEFYDGLPPEDKTKLHGFLDSLVGAIKAPAPDQSQQQGAQQGGVGQPPPAPAPAAPAPAGAAPVAAAPVSAPAV